MTAEQTQSVFGCRKYPWDLWFDGQARMLSLATHFPGCKNLLNVRNYIRLVASRRAIKVRLRRYEADGTIAVQAILHEAKGHDAPHKYMEDK